MKERPILFSTPMVKAILDGRKTQTRRVVKPQPEVCDDARGGHLWPSNAVQSMVHVEKELQDYEGIWRGLIDDCNPFGAKGDRLWVRETWQIIGDPATLPCQRHNLIYKADYPNCVDKRYDTIPDISEVKFKPSIHMPRWASRILVEITNIRVERLNDISESDCVKEGVGSAFLRDCKKPKFMQLWESIYGADSWAANPWVWVIEFKIIQGGEHE